MNVSWTKHRFSGGLLALDTTNTVVLRGDPARSFDRFEDTAEIARFAAAAEGFRSAELGGRGLSFQFSDAAVRRVIVLREAADRMLRAAVLSGGIETIHLPDFLRACAACLDESAERVGADGMPFGDPSLPIRFEAALAVSALSLLAVDAWKKVRICPNCNWLFVDRSRNSSRLWCDMSVCGNRNKAKRHYQRGKLAGGEAVHV
ncbi:CGNR zinc finger domain-containing protein [Mesorhizobium sp. KR9-304]|uniref:CGNR zinc finger domain-containing protein n=1 Tax=Mesorhizobium sp. KR9-304 TaxID=3156614 RepID=UPI0032B3BA18